MVRKTMNSVNIKSLESLPGYLTRTENEIKLLYKEVKDIFDKMSFKEDIDKIKAHLDKHDNNWK